MIYLIWWWMSKDCYQLANKGHGNGGTVREYAQIGSWRLAKHQAPGDNADETAQTDGLRLSAQIALS